MRTVNGVVLPRVLAPAQARAMGLTRARIRTELRRGNWQRLATGVLLTAADEPTRFDWAEVGVALAGPGSAVTGWEALHALGFGPRLAAPDGPALVLCRSGMNRVVGGVRLRRTTRPYTSSMNSALAPTLPLTPVVSAARAVADACLQFDDAATARGLVTSAIQRRVCSVDHLLAEARSAPQRGGRALRSAMGDAVAGARSAAEAAASNRLDRAGVPAFELNVPIVDAHGYRLYVVDVLWRELRAVLEIDSREYHLSEREWQATMARHNELTRCGLAVVHYPPSAIRRRGWVAEVIEWLRARATELGVAWPRARGVLAPPIGELPRPLQVAGVRPARAWR